MLHEKGAMGSCRAIDGLEEKVDDIRDEEWVKNDRSHLYLDM